MKVFCKVIIAFWVCVSRLSQSSQNNKVVMYLRYLKENGKNEVGFLLADKDQRFLRIVSQAVSGAVNHIIVRRLIS